MYIGSSVAYHPNVILLHDYKLLDDEHMKKFF